MKVIFLAIIAAVACGVEGPAGPAGTAGADGADGADGTDNRIVATHYCTGAVSGTVMTFEYSVALMAAGDIFSTGGVYDASFFVGDSAYFAAGQVGAATAPVMFSADIMGTANGGWWTISLNRSTGVTSLLYSDADASGGSDAWTMSPADCVTNTF